MSNNELKENVIYIGDKDQKVYLNAALFALARDNNLRILARGKYIKSAIDILAKLMRKFTKFSYDIEVKNVKFNDRYITEVDILFEKA